MDTKKLRQKILDLAIHGKLVPQDPNDEPASVLLERIRAEKEQLIKEGKIKAPKKSKTAGDTSHYQKDELFELPEGWVWCRIGDIADVARGGSPRPIESYLTDDPSGVNWIKIGDAEQGGKYINSTRQRIKPEGVSRSRFVHRGDFLLTNSMSFGRPYILNVDGCIHDGWLVISPFNNVLDKNYFYYLLSSEYAYQQFSEQASGAVVSNLNRDKVAGSLIPLPPQKEQIAIAGQIGLFFSWIECLESELVDVHLCLSKAKGKILDLAIHGHLVPQDPSDEPALELLRRINPAFQPSHNLHYEGDLPNGWCLTQLKDVAVYGDTSNIDVYFINSDSWILELEDLEKDTARIIEMKTKADREVSGVRHSFKKGQILYSKLRTYLNKVLIAPDDGFCTTEIVPVTACKAILPDYLLMVMRSPYFLEYTASCGYGVKMPRLGTSDAQKAVIPLPPLAEQARIVEKISELMTVLLSL